MEYTTIREIEALRRRGELEQGGQPSWSGWMPMCQPNMKAFARLENALGILNLVK